MDNKYENIVPWNGAQDTGRDVRLKLDRNFDRIKTNFEELLNELKKKLSNSEPDEAAEVIAFLKGLKVSDSLISRLLLRDTEVDELLDTDIMSALRVMAEIYENNDNLEKLFLSKVKKDRAAEHITFEKGGTAENGFIVRLPKQNTPASLMSCLVDEDIDTLIEEDEDAIVEVAPAESTGDMTLGGLMNVDSAADEVDDKEDYVIVKLKGESEWTLLPASSIGGGGSGIQRNVLIQNDLDSRNISASKGEPCYLKFTFVSQERYGIGGDYENTGERGLCQISIKNTVNAEFTVVKQMYIQSGYSNTVDVAEFLSSGSNQIMIKVTGEITEMTTSAFVYTVQLTSLSIAADNFRWWTAFTGENITIPLNIGGNISKTLYVTNI